MTCRHVRLVLMCEMLEGFRPYLPAKVRSVSLDALMALTIFSVILVDALRAPMG